MFKKIFHDKNLGKGGAIKSAQKIYKWKICNYTRCRFRIFSKDYNILLNEIETIKENCAVYGSRVLKKNNVNNVQNFSHKIRVCKNKFLTILSNLLNNQNLTDAHTCYKMFN